MPHDGVLVRLTTGFGGASASNEDFDLEISGSCGFFSFDLGGTIAERLALHGRLSASVMVEPTVSVGGPELEADDTSVGFTMLGLGLTYYTASDVYLTGVVGASVLRLDAPGVEAESDTGWGGAFDVGGEWHVGGEWGLGVAGRIEVHSVPNRDETRLVGAALGILFSATAH